MSTGHCNFSLRLKQPSSCYRSLWWRTFAFSRKLATVRQGQAMTLLAIGASINDSTVATNFRQPAFCVLNWLIAWEIYISGLEGRHLGFRLPVTWNRVHSITIEKPVTEIRKHRFCIWNGVSILCTSWDICISGFGSRHLVYPLPVTWDRVQSITNEKSVLENIGLELEWCFFLVYKLIYMYFRLDGRYRVFRLPVTWDKVQSSTIENSVVENIGFGFGMVLLSSVQA